ncbi:MAG: IPT/TIG domain-containing protein [Treponema sp.]|jgi:transglutaminase-like putative cysteine protease|nr:IPT/TIG domain-containing protein [Treponema sp.]
MTALHQKINSSAQYFLFAFLVLFFLVSCGDKKPAISFINPKIGMMGEVLTIQGKNFGAERNESYVTIAGIAPTSSSYLAWNDDQIRVRAPEFGESGLVYVCVGGKKSNGALFSNQAAIPQPILGTDVGLSPRIDAVSPATGAIGALISITGSGFGNSRERSGVWFSWDAETPPSAPAEANTPGAVEVFEAEFGYELWSDREIRVRLPDGAVSGNLEVKTIRGSSRPFYFEVSGKPGTKLFRDKRNYTISYSVNIQANEAENPNTLYLWVPKPVSSASQRNIELLSRSMEPFVEDYQGTVLYQLTNLSSHSRTNINFSYQVETYAVETNIRPQSIKQNANSPITLFTQSDSLIPSSDQRVKEKAAAITGRETNPYIKAQRIYEWLITEGNIQALPLSGGAIEALEEQRADPYMASLLFCALARAAGVPCLPVSGVLVNRARQTSRHYWVEFWIDGFGWVPADAALGAGAAPDAFYLRQDRASFYFGNLDSQRITFSRGQANLSQMDSRGRSTAHTRSYALQNLWEEVVGGLESYSSLWGDITVTGIYAQ